MLSRIFDDSDVKDDNANSDFHAKVYFWLGSCTIALVHCAQVTSNKYLAESIKKSMKVNNIKKFLSSDSKFLTNDDCTAIRSIQDVTVGNRIDQFADNAIAVFVSVPVNVISAFTGFARIYTMTNSFTAIGCAVGVSLSLNVLSYLLGQDISKYIQHDAEMNSVLLARAAFIESNKDSIALIQAEDFEYNFMSDNLNNMRREIPKLTCTFACYSFLTILSKLIGSQLFGTCLPYSIIEGLSPANIKNLDGILIKVLADSVSITNSITYSYPYLECHSEQLKVFDECYAEWVKLRKAHNKVKIKFFPSDSDDKSSNETILLNHFSVLVPKDHSLITILDKVDINLEFGKIYLLSGQSGSGKTTILKALVDCWLYTDGAVEYPIAKDNLQFIPQRIYIPPRLTLLEILAYPLRLKDTGGTEVVPLIQKAKHLLQEVNLLPSFISEDELMLEGIDWSSRLSGGQKQKIAIIRALLKNPRLLIMDEPTAGLDDINKKLVYDGSINIL